MDLSGSSEVSPADVTSTTQEAPAKHAQSKEKIAYPRHKRRTPCYGRYGAVVYFTSSTKSFTK